MVTHNRKRSAPTLLDKVLVTFFAFAESARGSKVRRVERELSEPLRHVSPSRGDCPVRNLCFVPYNTI